MVGNVPGWGLGGSVGPTFGYWVKEIVVEGEVSSVTLCRALFLLWTPGLAGTAEPCVGAVLYAVHISRQQQSMNGLVVALCSSESCMAVHRPTVSRYVTALSSCTLGPLLSKGRTSRTDRVSAQKD